MGLSQQRPQLLQQKQSDRLFTMSSLTSGIDTAVGQPGQSEQDRSKQTRARTSWGETSKVSRVSLQIGDGSTIARQPRHSDLSTLGM
ncbi:TPA: hypothetical protein L6A42_12375 [Pseudomonas aeruginosa]|nr:hypothetical protein T266_27560 [Pseudomonas aeruginosa VRFPA05]KHE64720.1 hypothetical protein D407_0201825 [Pseudomonas aeruginosa]RQF23187.1 hypothetical protein IPC280_06190 [Pseudomonas aeruginosa]HBP5539427.1 hypothetical protein [Pseudomonas aeruginosa]HBP5923577.1 hypothetical protein [Pseudomonas aeruginosa]